MSWVADVPPPPSWVEIVDAPSISFEHGRVSALPDSGFELNDPRWIFWDSSERSTEDKKHGQYSAKVVNAPGSFFSGAVQFDLILAGATLPSESDVLNLEFWARNDSVDGIQPTLLFLGFDLYSTGFFSDVAVVQAEAQTGQDYPLFGTNSMAVETLIGEIKDPTKWTKYNCTFQVAPGGASSFSMIIINNPFANGVWFVDSISVWTEPRKDGPASTVWVEED